MQNRAARAVTGNFDFNASVSEMILKLGWMNVYQRYFYFLGIMVFKCLHDLAPSYLCNKFQYLKNIAIKQTRSVSDNMLSVPRPFSETYKRSFVYSGSIFWNSLPHDIRNVENIWSFKNKLKEYVFSSLSNSKLKEYTVVYVFLKSSTLVNFQQCYTYEEQHHTSYHQKKHEKENTEQEATYHS